ncbi:hypothetical protein [Azospirillum oryzae]|uniref:hypothetical protein n=1 Tax=Azospirillum oryzae TaxID=286727 RepID=UPI00117766A7|nr:hypothetical protein [Azospirillum oryzae]
MKTILSIVRKFVLLVFIAYIINEIASIWPEIANGRGACYIDEGNIFKSVITLALVIITHIVIIKDFICLIFSNSEEYSKVYENSGFYSHSILKAIFHFIFKFSPPYIVPLVIGIEFSGNISDMFSPKIFCLPGFGSFTSFFTQMPLYLATHIYAIRLYIYAMDRRWAVSPTFRISLNWSDTHTILSVAAMVLLGIIYTFVL